MRGWLVSVLVCVSSVSAAFGAEPVVGPDALLLDSWVTSHMVLQRGEPVRLAGYAGGPVTVTLAGAEAAAEPGPDGRWAIELPAMEAGGPHELVIASGGERVGLDDVLVGEVWIASGQSNMAFRVREGNGVEDAQRRAGETDRIRVCKVLTRLAPEPQRFAEVRGWTVVTPETVGDVSAVAFNFAAELEERLGVPVGIVDSSWGGSRIEPWVPRAAYEGDAELEAVRDATPWRNEADVEADQAAAKDRYNAALNEQLDKYNTDLWYWSDPPADAPGWVEAEVPGAWEGALGQRDGIAWIVRGIVLGPEAAQGGEIRFGAIDDFDRVYVNGQLVGSTLLERSEWWEQPRAYRVPAGVLREGRNSIAVQVRDLSGPGGIGGRPDECVLDIGGRSVPLAGTWRMKFEAEDAWAGRLPPMPTASAVVNKRYPGGMHNAMVAPLESMRPRGVIWYQGEGNAGQPESYPMLFAAMTKGWREGFGVAGMPFLTVQLAAFRAPSPEPSGAGWPWIRAAQAECREADGVEMVLAIDVGDADDIHPKNKRPVGLRLAATALATVYGLDIPHRGPMPDSVRFNGPEAIVSFAYADGLTTTDGGAPTGFALAGADGVFRWAEARVEGGAVVLRCAEVPEPAFVRYAWENNPPVNLVNGAGFPAEPFRTDAFERPK